MDVVEKAVNEAIKLLHEKGYVVKKYTEEMRKDAGECADKDCVSCACNDCLAL